MLTLSEHLISPPCLVGLVLLNLSFLVVFCRFQFVLLYLFFWSLCCLSFFDLLLLIASLVSFGHNVVCPSIYSFLLPLWYLLVIVLSILLRLTPSYCLFSIFWSLCCLSFYDLFLLIASLVSFGHCIVCPSPTYSFLLPLWYLLVIVLSVLLSFGHCVVCPSLIYDLRLPLWYLLVIVLSVLL